MAASAVHSREFSPDLTEIGEARRFARLALPVADGPCAEDVVLVVSELVSNAVLHARGAFTVTVSIDTLRVRVEVTDPNPRMPIVPETTSSALSGRGLLMVQAITADWGVQAHPGEGKTVWAELPAAPFGDGVGGRTLASAGTRRAAAS